MDLRFSRNKKKNMSRAGDKYLLSYELTGRHQITRENWVLPQLPHTIKKNLPEIAPHQKRLNPPRNCFWVNKKKHAMTDWVDASSNVVAAVVFVFLKICFFYFFYKLYFMVQIKTVYFFFVTNPHSNLLLVSPRPPETPANRHLKHTPPSKT